MTRKHMPETQVQNKVQSSVLHVKCLHQGKAQIHKEPVCRSTSPEHLLNYLNNEISSLFYLLSPLIQ